MVDTASNKGVTKICKTLQEVLSKRKQTDAAIIIIHMGIMSFKVGVCKCYGSTKESHLVPILMGMEGNWRIKEGFLERLGLQDKRKAIYAGGIAKA